MWKRGRISSPTHYSKYWSVKMLCCACVWIAGIHSGGWSHCGTLPRAHVWCWCWSLQGTLWQPVKTEQQTAAFIDLKTMLEAVIPKTAHVGCCWFHGVCWILCRVLSPWALDGLLISGNKANIIPLAFGNTSIAKLCVVVAKGTHKFYRQESSLFS